MNGCSPLSSIITGVVVKMQPLSSGIIGMFYDFQPRSYVPGSPKRSQRAAKGSPRAFQRTPKEPKDAQREPKGYHTKVGPRDAKGVLKTPKEAKGKRYIYIYIYIYIFKNSRSTAQADVLLILIYQNATKNSKTLVWVRTAKPRMSLAAESEAMSEVKSSFSSWRSNECAGRQKCS